MLSFLESYGLYMILKGRVQPWSGNMDYEVLDFCREIQRLFFSSKNT